MRLWRHNQELWCFRDAGSLQRLENEMWCIPGYISVLLFLFYDPLQTAYLKRKSAQFTTCFTNAQWYLNLTHVNVPHKWGFYSLRSINNGWHHWCYWFRWRTLNCDYKKRTVIWFISYPYLFEIMRRFISQTNAFENANSLSCMPMWVRSIAQLGHLPKVGSIMSWLFRTRFHLGFVIIRNYLV